MDLQVKQDAKYQGHDWWKWSLWIEAPPKELRQIEAVTYTLHPTFPSPCRVVKDRARKFRLDESAWGEFRINISIKLKSGEIVPRRHWLELKYPPGSEKGRASPKQPVVYLSSSAADADTAAVLREALKAHNVQILTPEDMSPDLPLQASLRTMADRANASVAIVSDVTSPSVKREIDFLTEHDLPVIPVVVGKGVTMPRSLMGIQAIPLKDIKKASSVAEAIAAALRSRAIWE